jgi:transposase
MLSFKHVELAEKYGVSEATVRKWIARAKAGQLDLVLSSNGGIDRIVNTASNLAVMDDLVPKNKKYRNSKSFKLVTPKEQFYQLYNQGQIYDIVTNLEIHHEIPRQYNYFDGGAERWSEYVEHMDKENAHNSLVSTRQLLSINDNYLTELTSKYRKMNIVDLGVGNALPSKEIIARLLERNKLGRYIAIDISPEMLVIAERNIRKWFGNKVAFEGYELDISRERFSNILAEHYIKHEANTTGNLILFLGGTLNNFRKREVPLQVINDSMGVNDFLIHTQRIDTEATRRYFDFNPKPGERTVPPTHGLVVDLLNLDPSLYELEFGYDEQSRSRYEKIRFTVAITVCFAFNEGEREIDFNKGDAILLWRAWQDSALDLVQYFDKNDFYVLHSSQTGDHEYILTISQVKAE